MSIILVDSNMLNSADLLEYFSLSPNNKIVLPDYIAMEAYKGEKFESILSSMETILEYPRQVMVLHGTRIVAKLKDHSEILKWKFINKDQTNDFEEYCRQLILAKDGNEKIQKEILKHAVAANEIMNAILKDAASLPSAFKDIQESIFDDNERKILRTSRSFTKAMMQKIYYMAEQMGNDVYFQHPEHRHKPRRGVDKHCFLFRYGVATVFLNLRWIGRGGNQNIKPERMRNDLVDAALVVYSTYYDGLLTNDHDMIWLKAMTDRFLDVVP